MAWTQRKIKGEVVAERTSEARTLAELQVELNARGRATGIHSHLSW
jgi:hypothetical protein